jgi:hypothetical protein
MVNAGICVSGLTASVAFAFIFFAMYGCAGFLRNESVAFGAILFVH